MVGISTDSVATLKKFKEEHQLPHALLSDADGKVADLYGGRVPVVLHLLAPNRRAVQVTTDLAGFWERHYPALRRELMRRYPRHDWPEDPLAARPPPPRGRR